MCVPPVTLHPPKLTCFLFLIASGSMATWWPWNDGCHFQYVYLFMCVWQREREKGESTHLCVCVSVWWGLLRGYIETGAGVVLCLVLFLFHTSSLTHALSTSHCLLAGNHDNAKKQTWNHKSKIAHQHHHPRSKSLTTCWAEASLPTRQQGSCTSTCNLNTSHIMSV